MTPTPATWMVSPAVMPVLLEAMVSVTVEVDSVAEKIAKLVGTTVSLRGSSSSVQTAPGTWELTPELK